VSSSTTSSVPTITVIKNTTTTPKIIAVTSTTAPHVATAVGSSIAPLGFFIIGLIIGLVIGLIIAVALLGRRVGARKGKGGVMLVYYDEEGMIVTEGKLITQPVYGVIASVKSRSGIGKDIYVSISGEDAIYKTIDGQRIVFGIGRTVYSVKGGEGGASNVAIETISSGSAVPYTKMLELGAVEFIIEGSSGEELKMNIIEFINRLKMEVERKSESKSKRVFTIAPNISLGVAVHWSRAVNSVADILGNLSREWLSETSNLMESMKDLSNLLRAFKSLKEVNWKYIVLIIIIVMVILMVMQILSLLVHGGVIGTKAALP